MDQSDPWATDRYRVETPERIDLEYDVAGLGSRLLAALVDTTLVIVLVVLLQLLGSAGLTLALETVLGWAGIDAQGRAMGLWVVAALVLLAFALVWGYYLFFELIWHGQSPGKRWVGLRVIKEGGYPLGFVDSAIRNLVRLVDFLPFLYLVGSMVMLLDRRSRRLGDLAAGTLVVKERRELKLEALDLGLNLGAEAAPSASSDGPPAEGEIQNLHRLTPADQALLREYFLRQPSLAGPAASALAGHLAAAFARKLDQDLSGETPELFLARLARQMNLRP